jgi:alpha-N-arabinofuranosidase
VVGSLGCAFSTVTGNVIHDIHFHHRFGGAEMAGIKFHGGIDVTISHNHIYRCGDLGGIWLDWMGQGAQVVGNLLHDNTSDIFCEMQHGPVLLANNLFLSKGMTLLFNSQGIAVVHNLIAGPAGNSLSDTRITPFQKAHSTEIGGMHADSAQNDSGDHRFYNNLVSAPCKLSVFNDSKLPCFAGGNVFVNGAQPAQFDTRPLLKTDFDAGILLEQKADGWYLTVKQDEAWRSEVIRRLVTTELLGKARISNCAYESVDGSPLRIDSDYFGKKRSEKNPFPGPFENPKDGTQCLKVWPIGS